MYYNYNIQLYIIYIVNYILIYIKFNAQEWKNLRINKST